MRKSVRKPRSIRADPSRVIVDPARGLVPGDVLKVERRYVVDGVVTCVTDQGRYGGVEMVGSLEHIVIEAKDGLRMIPLASVSEIQVVGQAKARPAPPSEDPAYR